MSNPDRQSVYRQLYHTANGLDNRRSRPSRSSTSSPSPWYLNPKVVSISLSLGITLSAVIHSLSSLGSDKPVSDEEEKDPELPNQPLLQAEDSEKREDDKPESDPVERRLFDRVSSFFGRPPEPATYKDLSVTTEPPVPSQPGKETEATTATKTSSKRAPTPVNTNNVPTPQVPEKVMLLRRGRLDPRSKAERSSQSDNELFVGKYSRLSNARLSGPELTWAKRLVRSGASIRGRAGRSFLPVVKSTIINRAKAYGLDPSMMVKVASLESGGDPNAVSSTGAIGVYQFTSATAAAFGLHNRFDMDANVEAGMQLTLSNQKRIPEGRRSTLSVYLAHQIGIGSALEVISSPPGRLISTLSPTARRSIRVNVGGKSKTVGQYLSANEQKLESSYSAQLAAGSFAGKALIHAQSRIGEITVSIADPGTRTVTVDEPVSTPDVSFSRKRSVSFTAPEVNSAKLQSESIHDSPTNSEEPFQTVVRSTNGSLLVM